MLEHSKLVLKAVAQYPVLFKKELQKSLMWLSNDDKEALIFWVRKEFDSSYNSILDSIKFDLSA